MDVVVKGTKYGGMVMLAGKSDGWMDGSTKNIIKCNSTNS